MNKAIRETITEIFIALFAVLLFFGTVTATAKISLYMTEKEAKAEAFIEQEKEQYKQYLRSKSYFELYNYIYSDSRTGTATASEHEILSEKLQQYTEEAEAEIVMNEIIIEYNEKVIANLETEIAIYKTMTEEASEASEQAEETAIF